MVALQRKSGIIGKHSTAQHSTAQHSTVANCVNFSCENIYDIEDRIYCV